MTLKDVINSAAQFVQRAAPRQPRAAGAGARVPAQGPRLAASLTHQCRQAPLELAQTMVQ